MHFSESSSKYIENKQSQTTLPFGWDDASCMKTLKSMLVNSYNAVSAATLVKHLKKNHVILLPVMNANCGQIKP